MDPSSSWRDSSSLESLSAHYESSSADPLPAGASEPTREIGPVTYEKGTKPDTWTAKVIITVTDESGKTRKFECTYPNISKSKLRLSDDADDGAIKEAIEGYANNRVKKDALTQGVFCVVYSRGGSAVGTASGKVYTMKQREGGPRRKDFEPYTFINTESKVQHYQTLKHMLNEARTNPGPYPESFPNDSALEEIWDKLQGRSPGNVLDDIDLDAVSRFAIVDNKWCQCIYSEEAVPQWQVVGDSDEDVDLSSLRPPYYFAEGDDLKLEGLNVDAKIEKWEKKSDQLKTAIKIIHSSARAGVGPDFAVHDDDEEEDEEHFHGAGSTPLSPAASGTTTFDTAMGEAEDLASRERYSDAIGKLDELYKRSGLSPEQIKKAGQLLGFCYRCQGEILLDKNRYEEAYQQFQFASHMDDAIGYAYLGDLHRGGIGCEKSEKRALFFYEKALELLDTPNPHIKDAAGLKETFQNNLRDLLASSASSPDDKSAAGIGFDEFDDSFEDSEVSEIEELEELEVSELSSASGSEEPLGVDLDEVYKLYEKGEYKTAYEILSKLENRGARGDYYLGMILKDGLGGIEQDQEKAHNCFVWAKTQARLQKDQGLVDQINHSLKSLRAEIQYKNQQQTARAHFREMQEAGFFEGTNVERLSEEPLNSGLIDDIEDAYNYFLGEGEYQSISTNMKELKNQRFNVTQSHAAKRTLGVSYGRKRSRITNDDTGLTRSVYGLLYHRGILNERDRQILDKFMSEPRKYLDLKERERLIEIHNNDLAPIRRLVLGSPPYQREDIEAMKQLGTTPFSDNEIAIITGS